MLALWMRIRSQADLILILCLGALVRGVLFAAAAGSPERFWSQDDRDYLGIATHLHASYVADAGVWFDAGLRRPPVYPLFVRLVFEVFGQHYAAVVAVQLVLGVATIGLVFWLAGLMLSRRLALVAAALLAIDPASVIFTNLMLTETVFAFLLTAAIGLVIVARRRGNALLMAAAGVILGLSALTRPVAVYLPLVLAPVLVLTTTGGMANAHRSGETGIQRHRRSRSAGLVAAAVLVLGFALPVGTWVARNASQTGVAVLSTIDGHNMLNYRAVGALVESGELPWDARRKVNEQLAARVAPNANAAEVSRTQMWLGLEILAHHPVEAVQSWARGEARLLGGSGRAELAILLTGRPALAGTRLRGLVALNQIVTILIVTAALFATLALVARRLPIPDLWLLVAASVYFIALSGGPEAYSRFRVPVAPLLVTLAAAAFAIRRRPGTRRLPDRTYDDADPTGV